MIYILDDNQAVGDSLKFLFKSVYAFDVVIYDDPLVFLSDYRPDWFGCLIVDLMMPSMNGMALITELKQRGCILGILMISGHATASLAEQSLDAGADAFIRKPFNIAVLLEKVDLILAR